MSVSRILDNAQDQQQQRPRFDVEWFEEKIFVAKVTAGEDPEVRELDGNADLAPWAGCVMVGVKRSSHRNFPLYRFAVGTILPGGRFVPGFTPRADLDLLHNGKVVWDTSFECLGVLLKAAEYWLDDVQSRNVDAFVQRSAGKPEVATKRTGKTERERAKGKAQPKRD